MLRRAFCTFLAAMLLLAGGVGTAAAYTPEGGALFNHPRGGREAQDRIITHLVRTIESTPRYSTIRIAAYSNDRPDVVDALIAAHQRGVDVQMVLNDNWTSAATKRLIRVLGQNPDRRSFVSICAGSCRGGAGNQHMKFYLFSRAGQASNVVMVGSANTTGFGAKSQWNDMYTATSAPGLRELFTKIFEQLVRDVRVSDPYVRKTVGTYESEFFPVYGVTADTDPVMRRLDDVRCAAGAGTGVNGRTVLRIVMYGWRAERGLYLADKVAALSRQGCDVRVLVSSGGRQVVGTLKRGGALVKSADLDLDNDEDTGFGETAFEVFTHEKYMLLSGGYRGASSHQTWTGSENWSGRGLMNDEVTLRIPGKSTYTAYLANFDLIWRNWSRWL